MDDGGAAACTIVLFFALLLIEAAAFIYRYGSTVLPDGLISYPFCIRYQMQEYISLQFLQQLSA